MKICVGHTRQRGDSYHACIYALRIFNRNVVGLKTKERVTCNDSEFKLSPVNLERNYKCCQ